MCVCIMLHHEHYTYEQAKAISYEFDICYHGKRTFVYEVEAAHARYLDRDPY